MSETESIDWMDVARSSRRAFGFLFEEECYRSAVSRAYYAAYSRVSHEFQLLGIGMPSGREGPSHAKIRPLIEVSLVGRKPRREERVVLSDWVGRLYALRLAADYSPAAEVGRSEAREALTLMTKVFDIL